MKVKNIRKGIGREYKCTKSCAEMELKMEFRPCIDIHNGKVKQIVGGSLKDGQDAVSENFVSGQGAAYYAEFYKKNNLKGGHVILLNAKGSEYYEKTRQQALSALRAYPGGLQIGGGIHDGNAEEYLEAGASHVIVTSYVFRNGRIEYRNLEKLANAVGKNKLVLDLSCRSKNGTYYIVTDRWQNYTRTELSENLLDELSCYCSEFLIHAVDVEGKANGIEERVVSLLGNWGKIPVTYAGGVHDLADLEKLRKLGNDKINVTIGSALDLFGGKLKWEDVISFFKQSPVL